MVPQELAVGSKRILVRTRLVFTAYSAHVAEGEVGLENSYYFALAAGYGSALLLWLVIDRMVPQLWKSTPSALFSHPWKELGWAFIAAFGILGVGQLYQHHMLLLESGAFRIPAEVLNQALIFSPVLFLLALRRHGLSTVWVRTDRVWLRMAIGLGLALFAIRVFTLVRSVPQPWLLVTRDVYNQKNLGYAAQVLGEDIAIAMLLVRLSAAIRPVWAILGTAALFSAGHIPGLLHSGARAQEFVGLVLDFGLVAGTITILRRSADIWWFWCIHFAMDMMQFFAK
jgi:CAAX prenyl protease-like protein